MRNRKRSGFFVTLAAALGVGVIAYPGSAAAEVVVPACTYVNSTGNKSCVRLVVAPANAPNVFGNARLGVRTRTLYARPGNKAQGGFARTVTLLFDNDFRVNPLAAGGAPKTHRCPVAAVANKTVAQAWAACGPNGRDAHLTALPAPNTISGKASTAPPSNFGACTMVFQGRDASHITLYARVFTTVNSNPACDSISNPGGTSPATQGNVTVTLEGTLANAGVAGFGKKLTVPGIDSLTLPLDDFYATVRRGNFFQARCPAGTSPWRLRGIFVYSGAKPNAGGPNDAVNAAQGCS